MVLLILAGDQFQHRRLSRTVTADQADPFTRFDSEVRVNQQRLLAKFERDVFEAYKRHG